MLSNDAAAVLRRIDEMESELLSFLQSLVRIPTVNPPGENYTDCAELIGRKLQEFGYETSYVTAEGLPECTSRFPRTNVVGRLAGAFPRPVIHFNGHIDVVPAGDGWTLPPFEGLIRDGRIYGRGVTDQKAGIAASIYAVEAIRRCGIKLPATIEQSGTVDEESGGFAGVAYLAQKGLFSSSSIDYVVITEPLDFDRVCIGHRGVYWFEVIARGRTAHGSMPFLGVSAIDGMSNLISRIDRDLKPGLNARRTATPVVPDGARAATINVNSISGGQPAEAIQTPCVADYCKAVFDRRFLLEESLEQVKAEIKDLIGLVGKDHPGLVFELNERMTVHPSMTRPDAEVVTAMAGAIESLLGKRPPLVASPGTYDHKHFSRIAGIEQCIAYGPGLLDLAHQPDEYCEIAHLIQSCKAMALAVLRLSGL